MSSQKNAGIGDAVLRFRRERIGVYRGLFLKRLAQWPLRAMMRRVAQSCRREPHLIAFGAVRDRFADNPAYLFISMSARNDVRCVWITGSRRLAERLTRNGYNASYRWSRDGVRAAMRASFHVYGFALSDVHLWLSDGATTFNLWHGVGVKRVQRDRSGQWTRMYAASNRSLTGRVFADDRRAPDWLLTTSPETTTYFAGPFSVPTERCVELGYPRNDHLLRRTDPPEIMFDRTLYDEIAAAPFVVGYFPTWRYDSLAGLPEGSPDLEEIAAVVGAQGGVVLFKAHFGASTPTVADRSSLVILPADADLHAYLALCDVLITDYSSVAADFLLLDRPIITFAPDLDEDLAQDRFSIDPFLYQPGTLVRTATQLFDVLADVRSIRCEPNFGSLREHYWAGATGNACARIGDFITAHSTGGRAVGEELPGTAVPASNGSPDERE